MNPDNSSNNSSFLFPPELSWLAARVESTPEPSHEHRKAASDRLDRLTKPPGSLGRLEALGQRLAAVQGRCPPAVDTTRVVVFAADHGVVKSERVTPYPQEVTAQMVANFLRGGAAICAIAKRVGAHLRVVDVGVARSEGLAEPEIEPDPTLDISFRSAAIAAGTRSFTEGPAMDAEQLDRALRIGFDEAERCALAGVDVVAVGEMGIGNTSAASAISACLTNSPVDLVTGPGTGSYGEDLRQKVSVIRRALEVNDLRGVSPLEVLRCVGGFELAAICGFVIGAAHHRIAVVADGFISTAAIAVACAVAPACRGYIFAGHRSCEPGHARLLEHLDLQALLELDLRLGEGTGAALALPLMSVAASIMGEMATFDEAGVAEQDPK